MIDARKYNFNPSEELLKFADTFSGNCDTMPERDYYSSNNKYHIRYLDVIRDKKTGNILTTTARVGHDTGIMEISKAFCQDERITPHFIYWLILWLVVQKEIQNALEADRIVTEYYLKNTNRPENDLLIGMLEICLLAPSQESSERYKQMGSIIGFPADPLPHNTDGDHAFPIQLNNLIQPGINKLEFHCPVSSNNKYNFLHRLKIFFMKEPKFMVTFETESGVLKSVQIANNFETFSLKNIKIIKKS